MVEGLLAAATSTNTVPHPVRGDHADTLGRHGSVVEVAHGEDGQEVGDALAEAPHHLPAVPGDHAPHTIHITPTQLPGSQIVVS